MSVDIVEFALNTLTDAADFEKLASEIMRLEGFRNIIPLGGTADRGKDATADVFSESAGRIRIVFQYTMQEYLEGKLKETVKRLDATGTQYGQLVIVTPRTVSTARTDTLISKARDAHGLVLAVYDRKTLVNRLADFSNGIFYRHFPSVEHQLMIAAESREKALLVEGQDEEGLLRMAAALLHAGLGSRTRRSVFDTLVSACAFTQEAPFTLLQLSDHIVTNCPTWSPNDVQLRAACGRLERQGLLRAEGDKYIKTPVLQALRLGQYAAVSSELNALIADIVENAAQTPGSHSRPEHHAFMQRNVRALLLRSFRLMGMEIALFSTAETTRTAIYQEASEDLIGQIGRDLPTRLGQQLAFSLAEVLSAPTEEQAHVLALCSRVYVMLAVLGADPLLANLQATRLSQKTFVLDTDFVLNAMIAELPTARAYRALVTRLVQIGANVIVPRRVTTEMVRHAAIAINTLKYFGVGLHSLPACVVEEKVGNAFVKGYYYTRQARGLMGLASFAEYMENYYAPQDANDLMTEVLLAALPGVKIVDVEKAARDGVVSSIFEGFKAEMVAIFRTGNKAGYRTDAEIDELAENDTVLFLGALAVARETRAHSEGLLGRRTYLVTSSSKYMRACKKLGLQDEITTRPQALLAILETIGVCDPVDDVVFVEMMENPLMQWVTRETWAAVEPLVRHGLDLRKHSLPRARWDYEQRLHAELYKIEQSEKVEEAGGVQTGEGADASFVDFLDIADELGYRPAPIIAAVLSEVERARTEAADAKQDAATLRTNYDELSEAIMKFGRRKSAYLRRMKRRHETKPR